MSASRASLFAGPSFSCSGRRAMRSFFPPCLAVLLTIAVGLHRAPARAGLISLIQNNVLGSAAIHKQQSWPFDPDVSGRRAPEFIALHGDKSERLIERIGLGLDGRQNERREQQAVRDYLYDQQQQQQQQQQNYEFRPVSGSRQPARFQRSKLPGLLHFPPGHSAR